MKKLSQIHWTVEQAAAEFRRNPRTISAKLKALSEDPAFSDGTFSTDQICRAVFGDIESERLRKTTEEADALGLANEQRRGELLDAEWCAQKNTPIAVEIKQIVMSSALADGEKTKL